MAAEHNLAIKALMSSCLKLVDDAITEAQVGYAASIGDEAKETTSYALVTRLENIRCLVMMEARDH